MRILLRAANHDGDVADYEVDVYTKGGVADALYLLLYQSHIRVARVHPDYLALTHELPGRV